MALVYKVCQVKNVPIDKISNLSRHQQQVTYMTSTEFIITCGLLTSKSTTSTITTSSSHLLLPCFACLSAPPSWPGISKSVWVSSAPWWWAGGSAGWCLHLHSAVQLQEFSLQQLSDSPLSLIPAVWGLQLRPEHRETRQGQGQRQKRGEKESRESRRSLYWMKEKIKYRGRTDAVDCTGTETGSTILPQETCTCFYQCKHNLYKLILTPILTLLDILHPQGTFSARQWGVPSWRGASPAQRLSAAPRPVSDPEPANSASASPPLSHKTPAASGPPKW